MVREDYTSEDTPKSTDDDDDDVDVDDVDVDDVDVDVSDVNSDISSIIQYDGADDCNIMENEIHEYMDNCCDDNWLKKQFSKTKHVDVNYSNVSFKGFDQFDGGGNSDSEYDINDEYDSTGMFYFKVNINIITC